MLKAGDQVPDFTVTTVDRRLIEYASLWQRKNLLLVSIPSDDSTSAAYIANLDSRRAELTAHDTECVVTADSIRDVPRPGIVIADRWGEVHFVTSRTTARALPPAAELVEWLRFVQVQCPECQGETR